MGIFYQLENVTKKWETSRSYNNIGLSAYYEIERLDLNKKLVVNVITFW